jgi:hypothetical protein
MGDAANRPMPEHPASSLEKELLPAIIELASIQRDLGRKAAIRQNCPR